MRSNVLLFLHILGAVSVLGGALALAATYALASRCSEERSRSLRSLGWRLAAGTVVAVIVAIALGEALRGKEDVDGTWVDVSSGIAYAGLLAGGIVTTILARLALDRPSLARPISWLAAGLVLAALATGFVMTAKP